MNTYTDLINDLELTSSDEAIVSAVLSKNNTIKRKKIRTTLVSVMVMVVLAASTITAGAVNDWDYAALLQRIFNNNQTVADSISSDINYSVVKNTYDGITFEVSALYADMESLFIVVEISSEEPMFYEPLDISTGSLMSTLILVPDSPNPIYSERVSFMVNDFSYYVIDETRLVAVVYFGDHMFAGEAQITYPDGFTSYVFSFSEAVAKGREFALLFGNVPLPENSNYEGLPLRGGGAEVRFTVNEVNEQNTIQLYPELTLDNDDVLNEIRINPFSIVARFEGNAQILDRPILQYLSDTVIVMSDGETIPLNVFDYDGGIIRSKSQYYCVGDNSSRTGWYATFHHDKLFDLDEIAAIIVKGNEIPVVR